MPLEIASIHQRGTLTLGAQLLLDEVSESSEKVEGFCLDSKDSKGEASPLKAQNIRTKSFKYHLRVLQCVFLNGCYSSCDQQLKAGLERTAGGSSHLLLVINAALLFQTMTKSAGSTLHQT